MDIHGSTTYVQHRKLWHDLPLIHLMTTSIAGQMLFLSFISAPKAQNLLGPMVGLVREESTWNWIEPYATLIAWTFGTTFPAVLWWDPSLTITLSFLPSLMRNILQNPPPTHYIKTLNLKFEQVELRCDLTLQVRKRKKKVICIPKNPTQHLVVR